MLKLLRREWYKVKRGQTLRHIAEGLSTTVYALIAENGLTEEVRDGQLLRVPPPRNLYTVQAGDSKAMLCGGDTAFLERNGTEIFYLGMRVRL